MRRLCFAFSRASAWWWLCKRSSYIGFCRPEATPFTIVAMPSVSLLIKPMLASRTSNNLNAYCQVTPSISFRSLGCHSIFLIVPYKERSKQTGPPTLCVDVLNARCSARTSGFCFRVPRDSNIVISELITNQRVHQRLLSSPQRHPTERGCALGRWWLVHIPVLETSHGCFNHRLQLSGASCKSRLHTTT